MRTHYHVASFGFTGNANIELTERTTRKAEARHECGAIRKSLRESGVILSGEAFTGLFEKDGDTRLRVIECNEKSDDDCRSKARASLVEIGTTTPAGLMLSTDEAENAQDLEDIAFDENVEALAFAIPSSDEATDFDAVPYYRDLPTPKKREAGNACRDDDDWAAPLIVVPRSRRVLLYGPPATGKSTIGIQSGLDYGKELFVITMTDQTPMAELRGHFVPRGGQFVWMDGPALRAFRIGGTLIVDEICEAGADALQFLLGLLNDPAIAKMTLPTGETVRAHPDFRCVATMNGVPEDIPDALQSRFPVKFEINSPAPGAINRLPEDLRAPARKLAVLRDETKRVDLRAWLEFADLRTVLDHERLAAKAVFGPRFTEVLQAVKIANEEATATA